MKEMTFGGALEALKAGKKVARTGWNGKGMYLYLADGKLLTQEIGDGSYPFTDSIVIKPQTIDSVSAGWLVRPICWRKIGALSNRLPAFLHSETSISAEVLFSYIF